MKKIFLILGLAFTLTAGMAVITVLAHTDQAMAAGYHGRCSGLDAC